MPQKPTMKVCLAAKSSSHWLSSTQGLARPRRCSKPASAPSARGNQRAQRAVEKRLILARPRHSLRSARIIEVCVTIDDRQRRGTGSVATLQPTAPPSKRNRRRPGTRDGSWLAGYGESALNASKSLFHAAAGLNPSHTRRGPVIEEIVEGFVEGFGTGQRLRITSGARYCAAARAVWCMRC